jgi:peptide/nickel transport system permease protein
VLFSIPVVLAASLLVFLAVRRSIDPTAYLQLNPRASAQDRLELIKTLGLDRPLLAQYWSWLASFVQGEWGTSLLSQRSVFQDVRRALTNSLVIVLPAVALSLLLGIALGVWSAVRQYSAFDTINTGIAFLGLSIPSFWLALILQVVVGVYVVDWFGLAHPVLPVFGMSDPSASGFSLGDLARHLVLPAAVLTVQLVPVYSRYVRASTLEAMQADYITTARSRGATESRVIIRHALRNSLIPVTTEVALNLGTLAGGLIIIETVFQWPGMGAFFINAMQRGDYPQVLAWLMVVIISIIIMNLLADIAYALLDPRIRYE